MVSWCSEETSTVCAPLPLLCHWEQLEGPWLCLCTLPWSNCVWYWGIDQIPLRFLFPNLTQAKLSQPFLTGEVWFLYHLHAFTDLSAVCLGLVPRSPELDKTLWLCPDQGWVEGKDHLHQPAVHNLLLWPRIPLTFSAARVHCWLTVTLLPTFSAKLFSKWLVSRWLVYNIYWCTSYWTSWGSCQAISPGSWGPSGW